MLTTNALTALRDFMSNSIASARWRSGSNWHDAPINGIDTLSSGSVRVRLSIAPEETVTVDRVELLDENGDTLAYQDVSIAVAENQPGFLFWFDFTIREEGA